MLTFPEIDPVLISLGPLAIRWYGVMYVLTFVLGWPLLTKRAQRFAPHMPQTLLDDLMLWILLGVVLGGRLGYVLFYQFGYYLSEPMAIWQVWRGGMSFHGGLLGVLIAGFWFAKRRGHSFLMLADLVIPIVPMGLFFGRIGNFINGELWGRVTVGPWGMVFPNAGLLPRHPSQLYEAGLEGILLFVILWTIGAKPRPQGMLLAVFLMGYAVCRFVVEFAREPDAHLGFLQLGLTMGQWLCVPMLILGLGLARFAARHSTPISPP